MFNNKKAHHGFSRFIIYLTYLGWCCSQNCDKCESFGDMVKSVELVVHWFPYGPMGFRPLQKICCSHASKTVEIPSHHGIKNQEKDKSSKCSEKKSLFSFWKKFWGKCFWRATPKIQFSAQNRENCKNSGFFGPQNLPWGKKKRDFRSTTTTTIGVVGLVG